MKTTKMLTILILTLGLMACQAKVSEAAFMGNAFTYQGHLYDANHVANGEYDFQFKLYDSLADGSQVSTNVNKPDVNVIDGYFTVELNFGGGIFDDNARWLEIGVRPGDSTGGYTVLSPRQKVTPTPYAIRAYSAKSVGNNGLPKLIRNLVSDVSDTISSGDVVSLVNNGTTVRKGQHLNFGLEYAFNHPDDCDHISAAALSETKFVVVYTDSGNFDYGTAVLGSIAGNSITFGPEYVFCNSYGISHISVAALTETKFVVTYKEYVQGYNTAYAKVGIVMGNSLDFLLGTPPIIHGDIRDFSISVCVLSDSKFVVAAGHNVIWYQYGIAKVGEVSGTSIVLGSPYAFTSGASRYGGASYISTTAINNTQFVVAYRFGTLGEPMKGKAVVGRVPDDGNSITFGSEYIFEETEVDYISTAALSDNRFVVAYRPIGGNDDGVACIGGVDGNTISFGRGRAFNENNTEYISVTGLSAGVFVVTCRDADTAIRAIVGLAPSSEITIHSSCILIDRPGETSTVALSDTTCLVVSDYDESTAVLGEFSFAVGIADAAASGGAIVPVIINGISDNHFLQPGRFYYARPDGSLTLEKTSTGVGLAISSQELLLDIER